MKLRCKSSRSFKNGIKERYKSEALPMKLRRGPRRMRNQYRQDEVVVVVCRVHRQNLLFPTWHRLLLRDNHCCSCLSLKMPLPPLRIQLRNSIDA